MLAAQTATAIHLLSFNGSELIVRFGGERHEVALVRGDREAEPAAYFCPATAAADRYVSGPRAGQQVTPPAVIAALESIDEDALQAQIDALVEQYVDEAA